MPESTADRTQPATRAVSPSGQEDEEIIHTELFKGRDIKRSDTPETLLTEFTNRPDITMLCDRCCIYIDVKNLAYHKAYHEALQTMKYQFPHKPTDVTTLLHRRNTIMRRMRAEATPGRPMNIQDVTRVNEAYELLKSDLEDIYEEIKQIREKPDVSVKGVSLNCSPKCAFAVGMCNSENRRWKSYMEDTKVYQDYFGEDRNKCYLAIFDGYHGMSAAERAACELHHLLLNEMSKFDAHTKSTTARNFAESAAARTDYELLRPETRESFRVNIHQDSTEIVQGILDVCYAKYDSMNKDKEAKEEVKKKTKKPKNPFSEKMHKAFEKTYHLMDILLSYGKDERSKVRWSGTSALTVVIQNTKDEKGLEEDNRLASLEEEVSGSEGARHSSAKPKSFEPPEELGLIHIANAGNTRCILVRDNKPYRLSKDHTPNSAKEKTRIVNFGGNLSSSEKDCRVNGVLSVTRGLGNHGDKKLKDCVIVDPHVSTVPIDQYAQFLVLASKGVWEVFSDEEVASLMAKMLPSQQIPPPPVINETLLPLFEEENRRENKDGEVIETTKSIAGSQDLPPPQTIHRGSRVSFSEGERNITLSHTGHDSSAEKEKTDSIHMTPRSMDNNDKPTDEEMDMLDIDQKQTKNVLADLHTEIGSRVSEGGWEDASLRTDTNLGLEDQYLTMEEHSNFQEKVPQTPEELRRELAKTMAETLTQAALLAKARDNITVMIVLLPGCGL